MKLGIPQSTYAGYETGKRKVPLEIIESLSLILDVSPTFLVMGKNTENNRNVLSASEYNLIKKYRTLDERGQRTVDSTLDTQYQIAMAQKETSALSLVAEDIAPYSSSREDAIDSEIEKEAEAYKQELLAEKRAKTLEALESSKGA